MNTKQLRHVIWTYRAGDELWRGRVAVLLKEDRVRVVQLAGKALPVELLRHVLCASIPDLEKLAKRAHLKRKYPWRIEVRHGYSGCVDYKVRVLRNEELIDQPIVAWVHVSMNQKLNEGLNVCLADLFVLLDEIEKDFPPARESDYQIQVIEPDMKEYFYAGIESQVRYMPERVS